MPTVTLASGKQFDSRGDVSILESAENAGLFLPYSCKTGRCSTCKAKVIGGQTTVLSKELGLSEAEIASGWILSCVRSACSDVMLEVEDLGDTPLPPSRTVPCRIASLRKVAPDVLEILLRLPPTAAFDFLPGQYVDVVHASGARRSYSLANAPARGRPLELHVRAVENGVMSDYWFNHAKVNDLLRLNGPKGTFFLRGVSALDLVFLATGTGIAPVKSILEALPTMPASLTPRSATVYWGGASRQDLYFGLSGLPGQHRFVPVLSREFADWGGARGHVQDVFLASGPDLARSSIYACGSNAMIQSARRLLVGAGLAENRFHSDAFVCSSAGQLDGKIHA